VWKCDNHPDCADGSDELSCDRSASCPEKDGKFLCTNGMCTQASWVCDGQNDCGDNSDEYNCGETPPSCAKDQMMCQKSKICISNAWVCDGDLDCPDGEDENSCVNSGRQEAISSTTTASSLSSKESLESTGLSTLRRDSLCLETEFQCREKHFCIHGAWTCDGDRDCPDGSDEDEAMCADRRVVCSAAEFSCSNGLQCLAADQACDGRSDCRDGSDEEECDLDTGSEVVGCNSETEFNCGSNREGEPQCIPIEKVCDGKNDCGHWLDEPRDQCGHNECERDNGGCDQECVDTRDSYYCKCRPGFRLVTNNTCEDIDECSTPGVCSQICLNRLGGFKCDCLPGYEKEPHDHTRCKAIEGERRLVYAQKTDIRMMSLDLKTISPLVTRTRSSCALDFHHRLNKIFYTDIITQKIYSVNMDGSGLVELVSDIIVTPDGLAVDWVYDRLYWTDTGTNTIASVNLHGDKDSVRILVKDDIEEPRAIVLHPGKGWIFWSDWGRVPKIERSGMDGSHRETLHSAGVGWPNGLTLDLTRERLYWVDAKMHSISSSNIDGSDARIVLYSSRYLKHPFSITVFEDLMYWSEWESHRIYQADKFHGRNVTAVTSHLTGIPMVIQLVHPHRQPRLPDLCAPDNGGCSHICLPAPHWSDLDQSQRSLQTLTTCACPPHMTMLANMRTCVSTERKATKKLKKLPQLSDATHKVEAAAHKDTEAVHIINDDYSGIVGVVIGTIIGVSLIIALGLAYFYKSRSKKDIVTVKFNNPTFHLTGPGPLQRPQMGVDMDNCHQMPMFVDRNTSASYVDLRPNV